MTRDFPSIEILEARCSDFAKALLREVADHPKYHQIASKLMALDGTIFRSDIERALYEVSIEDPKRD